MRVTVVAPNVYTEFGISAPIGSTITVGDDYGASLVRSLKAIDTDGVLSEPGNRPFDQVPPQSPVSGGGGGGGGAWGGITGTLSAQTDLQSALDAKVPSSRAVAGKALTADVSLVKADVGLGNVDNTSDADKPVSTATLTALNAKQATLVSATNIKTINGASILGSGDMSVALNTTVTLEHLPSTTAWAATITPASYVSRFGFSSNVAITVTVAGVTSPAANIQIQYSNDAGVSISSGPTTIGTIAANGSQTINITPTTMPGGQFKVLITSGTGTGGTVGINVTMS